MATVFGTPTVTPIPEQSTSPIVPVVEGKVFPITITQDQQTKALAFANQFDITTIQQQNIGMIGAEQDAAIHKCLTPFLERIEKSTSANIFKLVDAFNATIEKEDLGALADRILNSPPSAFDKFLGMFSKKALTKGMEKAWNETVDTVKGKTASMKKVIEKMEMDTALEQRKVYDEITVMESLKRSYATEYGNYITAVAGTFMFLEVAKSKVAAIAASIDPNDQQGNFYLTELNSKLQVLESRYTVMETSLTRIPAEQASIAILTDASVKTLQESVGSSSATFASIKSTLISINGIIVTMGLQNSSKGTQNLNRNLLETRAKMLNQVVTTATESIGLARIEQAQQVKDVIAQTAAMYENKRKLELLNKDRFIQAQAILSDSRAQMLQLSQTVHI